MTNTASKLNHAVTRAKRVSNLELAKKFALQCTHPVPVFANQITNDYLVPRDDQDARVMNKAGFEPVAFADTL